MAVTQREHGPGERRVEPRAGEQTRQPGEEDEIVERGQPRHHERPRTFAAHESGQFAAADDGGGDFGGRRGPDQPDEDPDGDAHHTESGPDEQGPAPTEPGGEGNRDERGMKVP